MPKNDGALAPHSVHIAPLHLKGILSTASTVEKWIYHYFHISFPAAILWFVIAYFFLVWIFVLILYGASFTKNRRDEGVFCIGDWPEDGGIVDKFEVLFELSWTTLSTVGYGTTSPISEPGCNLLRYVLAIEAFLGILFAGLCSSIFYSKVSRLNAKAPVTFSNAVCLQYSAGRTKPHIAHNKTVHEAEYDDSEREQAVNGNGLTVPYPYLEFRVVNDRANLSDNAAVEILNCKLDCFVMTVRKEDSIDSSPEEQGAAVTTYDLPIESPELPLFIHGWVVRSILNEHSPVLKESIREKIVELGGWPSDVNDPESIRESLSLDLFSVFIGFTGTSNLTASTVSTLKVYKPQDIYIGWRFAKVVALTIDTAQTTKAKMMHLIKRKKNIKGRFGVRIDHKLVHHISPQTGGGNEPIGDRRSEENILQFLSAANE